jgi:hypothetical protein
MRYALAALALMIAASLFSPFPASAQGAVATGEAAWRLLQQDGAVALIRHGRTPGGVGDPPGFALEDCKTQRNLTDRGRSEMRALGEALRLRGIAAAEVLSSRWCRCLETARLVFGKAEPWPAIDNLFGNPQRVEAQTAELRKRIRAWKGPGLLAMSTHGANILPLTGVQPAEGEMVIVLTDPGGDIRVAGRLAPDG